MGIEKNYRKLESRYSVEQVCEILHKYHGLVLQSSRQLGCSRGALCRFIDRHPEARKAQEEGREAILDLAEGVLIQNLGRLDLEAAKFALSTLGKQRGYTTRTETEVTSGGEPIRPVIHFTKRRKGENDEE